MASETAIKEMVENLFSWTKVHHNMDTIQLFTSSDIKRDTLDLIIRLELARKPNKVLMTSLEAEWFVCGPEPGVFESYEYDNLRMEWPLLTELYKMNFG